MLLAVFCVNERKWLVQWCLSNAFMFALKKSVSAFTFLKQQIVLILFILWNCYRNFEFVDSFLQLHIIN